MTQADNEQVNLEGEVIESLNADKLSQFIETNNLHLVTEYNAVVNNHLALSPGCQGGSGSS